MKELYKKKNELTSDMIEQILSGKNALSVALNKGHRIALTPEIYDKYLKDVPKKEVATLVRVRPELASNEHMYFEDLEKGGNEAYNEVFEKTRKEFLVRLEQI